MTINAVMMEIQSLYFFRYFIGYYPARKPNIRCTKYANTFAPRLACKPVNHGQSIHSLKLIGQVKTFGTSFPTAILNNKAKPSFGILPTKKNIIAFIITPGIWSTGHYNWPWTFTFGQIYLCVKLKTLTSLNHKILVSVLIC